MPLNLHKIANRSLKPVQKEEKITFVRTSVSYSVDSFVPTETTTTIETTATIQPYIAFASNQVYDIGGRTANACEYFLVFITGNMKSLNQVDGLKADCFYARGKKYVVTSPLNWDSQMWSQAICREEADDRVS